jgi:hypothetical protein
MRQRKYLPKPIEVIQMQCQVQHLTFRKLRTPSGIFIGLIRVEGGGCHVEYRPSTGQFSGVTPDNIFFSSKRIVRADWYGKLNKSERIPHPRRKPGWGLANGAC